MQRPTTIQQPFKPCSITVQTHFARFIVHHHVWMQEKTIRIGPARLTKCQMKGSTGAMLTPKDERARKERILERFAKYTLMQIGGFSCYLDTEDLEGAASCIGNTFNPVLFNSFKMSLPFHLLEDETRNSSTSLSEYLTSTLQTILFGGGNYIVSYLKPYCLARETIWLRARFINIPKTKCIVF